MTDAVGNGEFQQVAVLRLAALNALGGDPAHPQAVSLHEGANLATNSGGDGGGGSQEGEGHFRCFLFSVSRGSAPGVANQRPPYLEPSRDNVNAPEPQNSYLLICD